MLFVQILSFINAKKPVEETGFTRFMTKPVIAIAIIVGCFIFTRISYAVLSLVLKRIADLPPTNAANWWKNSVRRIGSETIEGGEQRRRQRIDAATRMLHHFISLAAWIISLIAIFNVLDLNAAFFLSSAGFLGAGLAVGGQHRVNDYLTGLAVLLEDRYGVGDEIEAELGWQNLFMVLLNMLAWSPRDFAMVSALSISPTVNCQVCAISAKNRSLPDLK